MPRRSARRWRSVSRNDGVTRRDDEPITGEPVMTEAVAAAAEQDIPEYPTPRDAKCPFLPPPELRDMHANGVALQKVRTWDGLTPWLVATHAAQRQLMTDP